MFNEPLYNAMCEAFGDVVLHGEGTPITLKKTPTTDGLFGKDLANFKITADMIEDGGEYYVVNCPFCGDSRKRLWVCHAWGGLYEIGGTNYPVSKGLAICYNENCLDIKDNWLKLCSYIKGVDRPVVVPKTGRPGSGKMPFVEFPEPTYRVNDPAADPRIVTYLTSRGYDIDELGNHWDFRYGEIDIYASPVIIVPVLDKGRLAFWQARYPISGDIPEFFKDGRRKPKYYLPGGSKKSFVLYNFYRALRTDYIVLTEGVFDAARVGVSGVAMFGKDLSSRQLQDLACVAGNKTLIWIPDKDDPKAYEIAYKRVIEFNNRNLFGGGAHLLDIGEGDPADHSREEIWASISRLLAKR